VCLCGCAQAVPQTPSVSKIAPRLQLGMVAIPTCFAEVPHVVRIRASTINARLPFDPLPCLFACLRFRWMCRGGWVGGGVWCVLAPGGRANIFNDGCARRRAHCKNLLCLTSNGFIVGRHCLIHQAEQQNMIRRPLGVINASEWTPIHSNEHQSIP
jgi:hypothetical protein